MQIRNQEVWNQYVELNDDPYGKGIIQYAERWANLMEEEINKGKELSEIARDTSHEADTEGITGFMYGAAVATLASVWEHGEALRQWSNLDLQIGTEGEEANRTGGTLNPALMTIKSD